MENPCQVCAHAVYKGQIKALCDCPSTAVETAIAQCTGRWAMARGQCLNTSIVLVAVHGLSGLFRAVSLVEPSLFRPLPTLSPSLISHLASVDVKQQKRSTDRKREKNVSWFGLAVRRQAGKRKDLGSIPLRLSSLFKKVVVCEHCLITLSITSY